MGSRTMAGYGWMYPLVICYIAIENGHCNSELSHLKMVMFHSVLSLPEGTWDMNGISQLECGV